MAKRRGSFVMNLELIQQKGFEGLRVKTKDQDKLLAAIENTAKMELDSFSRPEVMIVGPKGTFRAQIFAFNHGEILLEVDLPQEILLKPKFEMALLRDRKNIRETLVLLGAPVTGSTSRRKIRILQMTAEQYEKLNKLLSQ